MPWGTGQILGSVAHPPFRLPSAGTYWVAAYATPSTSITVYSPNPASTTVTGALIVSNVIATYNEAATGWGGIFSGTATVSGSSVATTGGAGSAPGGGGAGATSTSGAGAAGQVRIMTF